jgi:hypothetical protein
MEWDLGRRVIVVVAAAATLAAAGLAAAPVGAATHPPYPSKLVVRSELRFKANLVRDNLGRAPQLVFFGGSRSQRFDPVFARRRTGLSAVNIALSCARPEAAWGYLNWFYKRWPEAKIRWVWGMQSGMLRDLDLDPALLQDARFYRYFPDDLLAQQRKLLPDSVAEMPGGYGFLRNRYSSRGLLLWNRYDRSSPPATRCARPWTRTSRACSTPARRPRRTRAQGRTSSRPSRCSTSTGRRRSS